ncbi:MAG: hypothetical protein U5J96_15610 [Ignavibacteriaceae bacterium]|nr:hypothetical protein [Ignavibacteriaceae bacterium]
MSISEGLISQILKASDSIGRALQIRTKFEGTSCSIKLKDGNNDYNVFIDGRLHKIIRTTADTIYVLANGLKNKVHTLLNKETYRSTVWH